MKAIVLLMLLPFSAQPHDLWDVAIGKDYIIANSTQCAVTTYTDNIDFRSAIAKPLISSEAPRDLTASQKIEREKLMLAAKGTALKVSKASSRANPPNTRPTYDITATTKRKV